ncbi:MAG: DUF998 domain-containing protein [Methanobacteriaceae archaeon]|nr:DUF998 domain-containing protein [Methanobacteriaceae archaeon]MDP2837474.1 DUF998 domain-containing protein [Methanobacteriaceae archaeon]MDP3035643.1 DUF998 domain-containing protein [Methanobacteriaceae archaeon]
MKYQKGSIFKPENNHYKSAGILLLVGCIQYILAVNIAEAMFPGYSIALNSLSDLGGSLPLVEPAALIFNLSNILLGILIVVSVYLILKSGGCRLFSSCLAIFGICIAALGIFPEYTHAIHVTFATIAFISGSLALIFSYRLGINIPMTIISIVLGLTALITLISPLIFGMGATNPIGALIGKGGSERLIIYPIIIYLTALGGYLASRGEDWVRIRFTDGYW